MIIKINQLPNYSQPIDFLGNIAELTHDIKPAGPGSQPHVPFYLTLTRPLVGFLIQEVTGQIIIQLFELLYAS